MEKTLVLIKPDALQRNLVGEIISRFERKGLKIIGMKMIAVSDEKMEQHYAHHKDKPFFEKLKCFMQSAPLIAIALEGLEAVSAVRLITGETKGRSADAGTIRGDLSMSMQANVVHVSDSPENAAKEVERFFEDSELFDYQKIDFSWVYSEEERG